ncbi:MAG: FAD-binding oxidoreductase [Nitrososphaerales archaeon]
MLDTKETFQPSLRGRLILPEDNDYDDARRIWNGMIDKRPAMIVRCAGVADVISSVKYARENNLEVSIRGGGHNVAGNSLCDGGMVIDFSGMKSVHVDPIRRVASAEPGLTWNEFDRETQVFGLATTGGIISTTGIAGFTLGGGIGWLVRKYGLTLDNLLSVDIVTSDGTFLTASEKVNTDLFWGVRGGGGNFGIVTSFEYKLHTVGPIVIGGHVIYPLERAREVIEFFREFEKETPEELTMMANFFTAPASPLLPKGIHGKKVFAVVVCHCGSIETGKRDLAPLREFSKGFGLDMIEPMPYRVTQSFRDFATPPGLLYYLKSLYLSEITDDVINTVLEFDAKIPSPMSQIHIQQLGGVHARTSEESTAFSYRKAPFGFYIVSSWRDLVDSEKNIAWTKGLFAAMQKFGFGVYVNFLGEEGHDRVREAYGEEKYRKLVELKRKYDPTNFFHMNQNIRPE